jgi:hypothetical protein
MIQESDSVLISHCLQQLLTEIQAANPEAFKVAALQILQELANKGIIVSL